jgi:membrane-bound serine protease (ClpP class)
VAAVQTPILALPPRLIAAAGTSGLDSLVSWLDNPTVAFLLLALGIGSVMVEIANPGIIGTGVGGVILILLGLWSLSMQPADTVGVFLMVLAAVLFLVELTRPSWGVAGLLGAVALAAGGILLVDDPVNGGVPPAVVLPAAVVVGGAVVFAGRIALRTRDQPSTLTGPERMIGLDVVVERIAEDGSGRTFIEGAWWQVRSASLPLEPQVPGRVVAVDGLVLVVLPGPARGEQPGKDVP